MRSSNILIFVLAITGMFMCKTKASNSVDTLRWYSIEEGLKLDNKEGKRYLVQIINDKCLFCDIMDEKSFSHPGLSTYLNENYIPIKFHIFYNDTLEFQGKKYGVRKFGRTQIHSLAEEWLVYWYHYPTTVIMDKDFNRLNKFSGYKDPEEFLMELKKM